MSIEELIEENAVLRSQVENADVNLEQQRLAMIAHYRRELDAVKSQRDELYKRLLESHKLWIEAKSAIDELKRALQIVARVAG